MAKRSLFTQFQQMNGTDTFFDTMYHDFAETCGRHYKSENVTVVSGSSDIVGSSAFEKTEVGNYIIVETGDALGSYEITAISGSTATVSPVGTGNDSSAASRRHYYSNAEDDFNYIRKMMHLVIGEDAWNDTPNTDLRNMAYLIPKIPNKVGETGQYTDRPGTVGFAISDIDQTGYISSGIPAAEYTDNTTSGTAGASIRFTDDNTIVISITGGFYPADTGTVSITRDGATVGTLDLATAWTNDGCSYEETESDVGSNPVHTSAHAGTDIIDLSGRRCMNTTTDNYPSFWPPYQMASMSATLTLPAGFQGQITVQHTVGGSQNYTYASFWVDTTSQSITANAPTIAALVPSLKYLSGVPYYGSGSTFTVTGTNNDTLFDRGLVSTQTPMRFNVSEFNSASITPTLGNLGLSNPCAIADTVGTYGTTITVGASAHRDLDARATVSYWNVFTNSTSSNSAAGTYRIDTYGTVSTDTVEYFDDEHKRYKGDENLNDTTLGDNHGADSNWVESSNISAVSGLVVYNSTLKYPTVDHSAFLPVGPDYTGKSGNHYFYRVFLASGAFTNGTITFSGWSNALSVVQGAGVTVELRMPNCSDYGNSNTATWQDLSVDQSTMGADGCLGSGSSGSSVAFSFGTTSSSSFGDRIVMKVTFASSAVTALTGITFSPTL